MTEDKKPIDMEAERVRFEALYLVAFNAATRLEKDAAYLAALRDGDGCGDRPYLNGAWDGWKMRIAAEE